MFTTLEVNFFYQDHISVGVNVLLSWEHSTPRHGGQVSWLKVVLVCRLYRQWGSSCCHYWCSPSTASRLWMKNTTTRPHHQQLVMTKIQSMLDPASPS